MLKDKGKGGYDESTHGYESTAVSTAGVTSEESTRRDQTSDVTYEQSTRRDQTSYDEESTRGRSEYEESTRVGSTTAGDTTTNRTNRSGYEKIDILDSESETLSTVPEEDSRENSEEDDDAEDDDESSSGSTTQSTASKIESAMEKGRCCPKMYPWWLCPPLWLIHPKKASKFRLACFANISLIGVAVYYFILIPFDVDNDSVTLYLWLIPTMIILFTVRLIYKNLKLTWVVENLAARVQIQINITNEMAEAINELGDKGYKYRVEVVNLRAAIVETKKVGKRLKWRNEQGTKEVATVETFIAKKREKPAKTVEVPDAEDGTAGKLEKKKPELEAVKSDMEVLINGMETQGSLVVARQVMASKTLDLNKSIDEQGQVLDDVKDEIGELQDYHDEYTDDAETMKQTVIEFQEVVDEFDLQVTRLEDIKEYTKSPMDASNEDMQEYLTQMFIKKGLLQQITLKMEVSIVRELFVSRQYKSGESGMTRETFETIKKEIPAAAQRAIRDIGAKATFDGARVQSKKKIMDSKLGRKKRPGIDQQGMKDFLELVERRMQADMQIPLRSLLKPGTNIET